MKLSLPKAVIDTVTMHEDTVDKTQVNAVSLRVFSFGLSPEGIIDILNLALSNAGFEVYKKPVTITKDVRRIP